MTDTNATREAVVPADVIERIKQRVQIIREQDAYSKQVGHAAQLGFLVEQHADGILALLATDRAAGVGESWKLVPVIATADILDAIIEARKTGTMWALDLWRDIIGASPPAPADASGQVQSDSADYDHTFYGILNGQGKFWSPLPFHDEATARARLERYAQGPNASMLNTHTIVPVRVVLTALDPKLQEPRP